MNPFVRLWEAPVGTLTAFAYAIVLASMLIATWWALGRNLVVLVDQWQEGWRVLVPGAYAARVVAASLLVALDVLLVAGIIHVLT